MKIWLWIVLLSIPTWLSAQETKSVAHNPQFWTSINSTVRATNRWGAMGDFHIRRDDFIKEPNFWFLRFGAVFWLDDQFSFAAGPAGLWLATNTNKRMTYAFEKRIFQQALWRSTIGRVTFLQRIRSEQRWHQVIDRTDGTVDRTRFSNRFRFLMSGTISVFENSMLPRVVVADELHFHVGKEIVYNTFDQNRIFAGISQRVSPTVTFDMGYMLVYQQRYSGYEYDANHTFRLFFYYSPDLRKKKDKDLPHYPIEGEE